MRVALLSVPHVVGTSLVTCHHLTVHCGTMDAEHSGTRDWGLGRRGDTEVLCVYLQRGKWGLSTA